jgi:hypothetical protein
MERLIEHPILISRNLNVDWDIKYLEFPEFIQYSYNLVNCSEERLGRRLDGFDTREHAVSMMYLADRLSVRAGYMDLGFKNNILGHTVYGCGIVVFKMDGWLAYYSPMLRCFLPEPKDGRLYGDISLKPCEIMWNQHCYNNVEKSTYSKVKEFMDNDETYKLQHSHLHKTDKEFLCLNFGIELKRNANSKGIRCGVVLIAYDGDKLGTHILNAFQTDDGVFYVEPQIHSLFIEEPTIGKSTDILQFEAQEREDSTYIRDEVMWEEARKKKIVRIMAIW